jgi:glucose-6-phosphate isomerase
MTEDTRQPAAMLGEFATPVNEAIARLERDDIVARIWAADHTVWSDDPTEISDRLGWLNVMREMASQVANLTTFANEIKDSFFNHVVVLGMGGSSLGPEVIHQVIGGAGHYPKLTVLDSTSPTALRSVARTIDPARTLFIVSSKSGGTIEPNSFYKYFRRLVENKVGRPDAGSHFVAITDPGTSLETLAEEQRFRRVFQNPTDMGGRYSVLSFFGMVPATLIGVDIGRLLARAEAVAGQSPGRVDLDEDSGAWLGAYLATAVKEGRDKLTLITSPKVRSFGLWVEQLLAESTGKLGTGIIPVVGEPLLETEAYGEDRAFVFLRVEGDDNAEADVATERLAAAGFPVVRLDIADAYDIGGEFFRWELATAVAGALMAIHPFDQPDVQAAKDGTASALDAFAADEKLPDPAPSGDVQDLLAQAKPGDYLAIMIYAEPSDSLEAAGNLLRKLVADRYKIATTLAFGPRFLHSTGQLHKGGPASGLYLQFTVDDEDLGIPGEPYGFGTLISAQAMGDFQALAGAKRRLVRVHLGDDAEAGILRLLGGI